MKEVSLYNRWMKTIFTIIFINSLLFSCSMFEDKDYRTVNYIDPIKYNGSWYVIENIPTIFEGGAYNSVEKYNFTDDKIEIDFTYRKDGPNGEIKSYPQKGTIYNKKTNAHWKIKIPWIPFKFDYLVIDKASDYSWVVVGVPNKSYVWIMSRKPTLAKERMVKIRARLKAHGYDITKLQKVPQIWD